MTRCSQQHPITKLTAALVAMVMATPLYAADPYEMADESWITLNGTVANAGADSFTLDYGEGVVTVEMDDWDWYAEGHQILEGDNVRVSGRVDDDLYELTTVEAASVYVKSLNSYFYASSADEEDDLIPTFAVVDTNVELSGKVTSINGREFTLDTGPRQITVDTATLGYNPLDNIGYQQVQVGDRVSVNGALDYDFFEGRELVADMVITLLKDTGKSDQ